MLTNTYSNPSSLIKNLRTVIIYAVISALSNLFRLYLCAETSPSLDSWRHSSTKETGLLAGDVFRCGFTWSALLYCGRSFLGSARIPAHRRVEPHTISRHHYTTPLSTASPLLNNRCCFQLALWLVDSANRQRAEKANWKWSTTSFPEAYLDAAFEAASSDISSQIVHGHLVSIPCENDLDTKLPKKRQSLYTCGNSD